MAMGKIVQVSYLSVPILNHDISATTMQNISSFVALHIEIKALNSNKLHKMMYITK